MSKPKNTTWKPVVGFGAGRYEVSADGRVWLVGQKRLIQPHIVADYFSVGLYEPGRGSKHGLIHRLVALAFIGPQPHPGWHVCHNDGDRTNNHVSNLRWDSPAGNGRDASKHGDSPWGERSGRTRLFRDQVWKIRELMADGYLQENVAARYGVSETTIRNIVNRKTWSRV